MTPQTPSTALAVDNGPGSVALAPTRAPLGLIRPIAPPAEVLRLQEETRQMVTEILQPGRDFGVIPGTDKPSMLKPGAERVALAFGCYYGEPQIIEREVDHDRIFEYVKHKKIWRNATPDDRHFDWKDEAGTSRGLYRYVLRVPVILRETNQVVGHGIGSCSTMESKYIDRPRDSENTALKMAHKRAIIGGCLVTFGLSDQFTQDTEDTPAEMLIGEGAPKLAPMDPPCPTCGGKMYDNRISKKKPTQPDFKCKNRACDGVIWPPRPGDAPAAATTSSVASDAPAPAPSNFTNGTAMLFPYGPLAQIRATLDAVYNAGATKTRKSKKKDEPDVVIEVGGEFVVADKRIMEAVEWIDGKLKKHRAAAEAGETASKEHLDPADVDKLAAWREDLTDEITRRADVLNAAAHAEAETVPATPIGAVAEREPGDEDEDDDLPF